jgi:hypothetical protein
VHVYVLTDFQCPVCRRIVEPLKYLARRHPNEVRLIVKQNALPSHRNATAFAAASMAAFRQGKFWPYHDRLFANAGAADEATLVGHAKVSNFVCTLMPATRRRSRRQRAFAPRRRGRTSVLGSKSMVLGLDVERFKKDHGRAMVESASDRWSPTSESRGGSYVAVHQGREHRRPRAG